MHTHAYARDPVPLPAFPDDPATYYREHCTTCRHTRLVAGLPPSGPPLPPPGPEYRRPGWPVLSDAADRLDLAAWSLLLGFVVIVAILSLALALVHFHP